LPPAPRMPSGFVARSEQREGNGSATDPPLD